MKVKIIMAILWFSISTLPTVYPISAAELLPDQAQEGINYGFWFDNTVDRWQEFKPTHKSLARVDLYIEKRGNPGNLRVAVKTSTASVLWETTIAGADIPGAAWLEISVEPAVPLIPNSSYYIQVSSDADSPNPENRFFWRGQTNSEYHRGISSVEESWPGYDFAFRTWSCSEIGNICYIYKDNAAGAKDFKSLLDANGYTTTLIPMSNIVGTDFSAYALILVGSDTGWGYTWGKPSAVEELRQAGTPILGLGYGGAALFEQLDLSIRWGHGWNGNETRIYAVNPKHIIFNSPINVPVPRNRIIELYKASEHIALYGPSLSTDVVLLGREAKDTDHYPLVQEGRHLIWGFTAAPASMTQTGKAVLVNVVAFMAASPPAPLYLSLNIEDAMEGIPVNKITADKVGPTAWTRLDIVAKLISFSSAAKNDIPVILTIPGDVFGSPWYTYERNTTGGGLTEVSSDDLGGGQYRVTTDLSPVFIAPWLPLYYRKQIVWRFLIPNDLPPQNISVSAEVGIPSADPLGNGTVRILAPGSVQSLILVNRKLLYEKYNHTEVNNLLQRLYTEAQGPPASHSPQAIIYNIERYHGLAYHWDNTAIDYTSEATANQAANGIDSLIEDWHDDATQYLEIYLPPLGTIRLPVSSPNYLLIVGDDDTIPFYRYNDPYNREQNWSVNSATNPAVHATDLDYYFTDNVYADLGGGLDWQTGDLELWVGRLLGASAADMLSLLAEGVDWNNGQTGGVVMASVDGWELGLEPDDGRAGEVADLHDVPALFRNKGFAVRNDDIPNSEVRTIDVMSPYEGGNFSWNNHFRNAANNAGGMDLFFIGGHDSYDHASIPGDDFSPDDTPTDYTRFGIDHPIAMIVGCHGGTPVPDIDVDGGADHCMVYDLIHEGARAYIGASGYSYGSPGNLHKCTWGERLIQRFFHNLLLPAGSNSMTLGKALAEAKRDYTFGFGNSTAIDALDRKTVTEFNLYGIPWSFIFYPDAFARAEVTESPQPAKAFSATASPIFSARDTQTYSQRFEVKIASYEVQTEVQDDIKYDLFSIKGGDMAAAPGVPILPFVKGYSLALPPEAKIREVSIKDAISEDIGKYNVPIAEVLPWSEGGLRYTTKTDITDPYPLKENLVQYQGSGEGLIFTVYPIQHNPASDETIYYSSFMIEVTYGAPLTLAITEFACNKTRYVPGEPIQTQTKIENIGATPALAVADLLIKNTVGEIVGSVDSREFTIPSGGFYVLPLNWTGQLEDGPYSVQIIVISEKTPAGSASQAISVMGGEILALETPQVLAWNEMGTFTVTFANYLKTKVAGEVQLSIQSGDGGYVKHLAPKPISLNGGAVGAVSFYWRPGNVNAGKFIATAKVAVDDQTYGPTQESFDVNVDLCEGDFNKDKDVDGDDLWQLMNSMATNCEKLCFGDFNGNGRIDESDLRIFADDYGETECP